MGPTVSWPQPCSPAPGIPMPSPAPSRADGNTHPPPPLRGYGVASPAPAFAATQLRRGRLAHLRTRLRCYAAMARRLASHPRTLAPFGCHSPGFPPRWPGNGRAPDAPESDSPHVLEKAYMTNGTRTNAPYLVVGFCFMLLGILLVLDRLEIVEAGTGPPVLAGRARATRRQHDGPGDAWGGRPRQLSRGRRHLAGAARAALFARVRTAERRRA